ncbi:Perlucin [Mizuhopecten yessoensis]|uniref:Perlucin n=2 Tax=Mizuhopecten yessoensis TaxID=6573 RepID=A0A210QP19_MIZYE|nr:Perlucin [Mizuhopecten yessoensis]
MTSCVMSILTILLVCGVSAANGCSLGWLTGPSGCYFLSRFTATWGEASSVCQGFGGKLAEPMDEDSYTFLTGSIHDRGQAGVQFSVGGSDMFVEGVWEWSSSGAKVMNNHWLPGEPNDDNNNGDCLTLHDNGFNDLECHSLHYFICEKE